MWSLIANAGKTAWTAIGLGGAAAAVDVISNPKDGLVANWGQDIMTTWANMTTEAGVDTGFQGFYKFFDKLADFIESFTGEGSMMAMRNWAERGMGEDETTYADLNGGAGADTVVGGAGEDTLGSITYTPENALTLENFSNFEGALSGSNILHKAHVLGHGVTEGVVHVASLGGHAFDAADSVIGWGASLFGSGAREWWGDQERDASTWVQREGMEAVNGAWDATVGVPELRTAWDRAVHFGGEMIPALATGYAAAPLLTAQFTGMAVGSAISAGTTTGISSTLMSSFATAVTGLGLTSTGGIMLNALGLASIPGLRQG